MAVASCVAGCADPAATPPARPAAAHHRHFPATPERAAIGLDASIRGRDQGEFRYLCAQSGAFAVSISTNVQGAPTASTVHRGSRWIVTVSYQNELSGTRYEVRQRMSGYCVARILPPPQPSASPSSPAPYTGTATTGPPK